MSPSRPFILRPVATSLLMAAILLAGIVSFMQLPVSALPEVDYPIIQVVTFYPGASPDVMASAVTAPLERQFGQVPGLNQMTSTSSDGSSVIVLQFSLDLNIDVAEQEVQASINAAQSYLPADLPVPPIYSKTNPADAPILTLALTSSTIPLSQVEDLADTRLAEKIAQVTGVGLVSISGGQKPAVRIQLNPTALSSYGINMEDVRTAVQNTSLDLAKGNFDGPHQDYQIDANDQLLTSKDFQNIVVAYHNKSPVLLSDVARVIDDVENTKQAAWMNTTPAVIMNIQRQPGANIIQVVDRVQKLLPLLKSNLPASVDVTVLTDRTTTIRASVQDVEFELMLTVGLVVMVIFLFLRNLSATIIPSVAVPLSLIGTFGVMYLAGYSLNNLTLMALTISTGFVVDDAIVMIENIVRFIEEGDPPLQAALKGSEQIGFTIVSLTISLIAVLIPLLFMGDIVGRLFREFAVTLSVTILVSAVVSLTLTPMMCAKLLKHKPESQRGTFLPNIRARLRVRHRLLWTNSSLGPEASDRHSLCRRGHPGPHRHFVHHRAQRIFPRSGHRNHPGHLGSLPINFISRHGRETTTDYRGDSERPGGRQSFFFYRNRRHESHAQQRPRAHQLETSRCAQNKRVRRDPPPAAQSRKDRRHHALHAARPGHHRRRPRKPHAVPIHVGRSRH